tara:strand:- start:3103 stop:4101 length:999 start_codon:yes stop_codon:yes gene_type:complete
MSNWLEARNQGLGGSDIAAIFGLSPWSSALTLWAEKTGRQQRESLDHKEFVEWGNRLEAPIMEAYWERTLRVPANFVEAFDQDISDLVEVDHNSQSMIMFRSKEHPWALATPDGLISGYQPLPWTPEDDEGFGGVGILEIKTTNSFKKGDWSHGPPPYYMLQAQHYMLVTGLAWASFAVLIGGQELKIFDVPRDDSIIASIIEKAGEFWNVNVQQDVMPEAAGVHSEALLLSQLFPGDESAEPVTLPALAMSQMDAIDLLSEKIKPLREQIRELEKKQTACKNNLKLMMGNSSLGHTSDGLLRVTYRMTRRAGYTVEPKEYRTMRTKRVRTI